MFLKIRLIALFAFCAAFAGCGGPAEPRVVSDARTGVLHISNDAEPKSLDPALLVGVPEARIMWALFEGLTSLDPETLEVIPGVAESWEVSDDGLRYTFRLRETTWSNGDPLTAEDFVFAWRRMLTPTVASPYAYMLYCLKNAEAFNKGELTDPAAVGVRALDDRTLEVELEAATPYFLTMHIHYTWFPLNRAAIEAHGAIDDPANPWTIKGPMPSNGPMKLAEWTPNRIIRAVKNDAYWDAAAVGLNEVRYYPTESKQTAEREYRTGQVHMTFRLLPSKVETYKRENPDDLKIYTLYASAFYRFNPNRPPLDDARVRRALAMAIDRDALCATVLGAGEPPAEAICPPDPHGYTPSAAIPYDVEGAKALLADAGYPNGAGFPSIEILYNTLEQNRDIAEAIQAMWKQNLGVTATLTNVEWKVYLDRAAQADFQVTRSGWYADFLDPINFLELFESGNGNNWGKWSSAEFDGYIAEARATTDPARRYALFDQAERVLLEDAPAAPLYYYVETALIRPEVKGWHPNLLSYLNFKRLRLEAAS